jgi:hypothetical protein
MATKTTLSARQRILDAPQSFVAELEPAKAARFKAATMLIPSPADIEKAIFSIPNGATQTLRQLRDTMAQAAKAGVTCPYAARVGWELVAQAAEEDRAAGKADVCPWWRVTKDGAPSAKTPGGIDNHRALLAGEGVQV